MRVASDSYVAHEHPVAGRAGTALCDTRLAGTAPDSTAPDSAVFAGTAPDSAPPPVRPTLSN